MWLQPTPVDFLGLTLVQDCALQRPWGFGYQLVLNRMDRSYVCGVLPRLRSEEVVP